VKRAGGGWSVGERCGSCEENAEQDLIRKVRKAGMLREKVLRMKLEETGDCGLQRGGVTPEGNAMLLLVSCQAAEVLSQRESAKNWREEKECEYAERSL
jgi:hypothetical protein